MKEFIYRGEKCNKKIHYSRRVWRKRPSDGKRVPYRKCYWHATTIKPYRRAYCKTFSIGEGCIYRKRR